MIQRQLSKILLTNNLAMLSQAVFEFLSYATQSNSSYFPLNLIVRYPLTFQRLPIGILSILDTKIPGFCWFKKLSSDLKQVMFSRYAAFSRSYYSSLSLMSEMGTILSLRIQWCRNFKGLKGFLSVGRDFLLRLIQQVSQTGGQLRYIIRSILKDATSLPSFFFFAAKFSDSVLLVFLKSKSTATVTQNKLSLVSRSVKTRFHPIYWQRYESSVWGALISMRQLMTLIQWGSCPHVQGYLLILALCQVLPPEDVSI